MPVLSRRTFVLIDSLYYYHHFSLNLYYISKEIALICRLLFDIIYLLLYRQKSIYSLIHLLSSTTFLSKKMELNEKLRKYIDEWIIE